MVVSDSNKKLGEISSIKIGNDQFINPKSVQPPQNVINQGFGVSQKINPEEFYKHMGSNLPQNSNLDPMALYMMMQSGQASDKLRAGNKQPNLPNMDQFSGVDLMTLLAMMQSEQGVNQMRSGVNPTNFMNADFSNKGYS